MHLATIDDDRLAGDVGGCGRSEVEAGVANVLHLGGDHPRSHPRSSEIIIRDYPRLSEISESVPTSPIEPSGTAAAMPSRYLHTMETVSGVASRLTPKPPCCHGTLGRALPAPPS